MANKEVENGCKRQARNCLVSRIEGVYSATSLAHWGHKENGRRIGSEMNGERLTSSCQRVKLRGYYAKGRTGVVVVYTWMQEH